MSRDAWPRFLREAAPFTRYARVHFDALVLLASLPPWQRAVYPVVILRCDQMPNVPVTWAELGKMCGTTPRNARKAVSAFKKLGLLEAIRIRDKDGGDEGLSLRFPWGRGGQPVTTPGGHPETIPGGQPVTTPGGQPVTTPFLMPRNPEEVSERPPPPNPSALATRESRMRANVRAGQGGGGWSFAQLKPTLDRYPRTPENGGLIAKWITAMCIPDDAELAELVAYFREGLNDQALVGPQATTGIKFPLAIACSSERFEAWRSRRRAKASPAVVVDVAAELAKSVERSPIGARRRPAASKPFDAAHDAASTDAASSASKDPIATLVASVGSEIPLSRVAKRASRA